MSIDVDSIKRKLLVKYPTFGSIIVNLEFQESEDLPTAGTDGKVLLYNSKFIGSLSEKEQIFIFAHEVCHVAFEHIFRSEGKDKRLWNIATDSVINALLKQDGLPMVEGGIDMPEAINCDAEEMYDKLLEKKKQQENGQNGEEQQNQQGGQGQQGQEENQKQQNQQGGQEERSQPGDQGQQGQQGSGGQQGQEGNKEQQDQQGEQGQQGQEGNKEQQNQQGSGGQQSQEENQEQQDQQGGQGQQGQEENQKQQNQQGSGRQQGQAESKEQQGQEENQEQQNQQGGQGQQSSQGSQNQSNSKGGQDQNSRNQQENTEVGHDSHGLWDKAIEERKKEQQNENAKKEDKEESKYAKQGEKETFKQNKIERKKQLQELSKELANKSSQEAGNGIQREGQKISNIGMAAPLIDWRKLLRQAVKYDEEYTRKNARMRNGYFRHRIEQIPIVETEILLDTSGSVSEVLLKNFLRECKNILYNSKVKVGCFNTEFHGFTELKKPEDIDNMKFPIGGGTDFDAAVGAFSRKATNKIIFTDGEAPMPREAVRNVIWVVFGNEKINPKGGKVINITGKQLKRLYQSFIQEKEDMSR